MMLSMMKLKKRLMIMLKKVLMIMSKTHVMTLLMRKLMNLLQMKLLLMIMNADPINFFYLRSYFCRFFNAAGLIQKFNDCSIQKFDDCLSQLDVVRSVFSSSPTPATTMSDKMFSDMMLWTTNMSGDTMLLSSTMPKTMFLSPIKSKRLFPRSEVVFTHSPDSEDVFSEPHQPMDVLTKTPGSPRPLTWTWLQRSSPPCFCPEAVFEILHG